MRELPTFLAIGAFMIIAFILVGYVAKLENDQWQLYSKSHHCKLTAHIDGFYSYGTMVMSNGKLGNGSVWNPSRETYLCDDGVSYTR